MKRNYPCYLFGMYKPDTDSIILMPSMIHIPARLLLSVVKNAIPWSCSTHLMTLRIYID